MMMKPLHVAFFAMVLAASPALAETFEEAVALYSDKDYKAALQVAKPLAEKGDVRAMAMLGDPVRPRRMIYRTSHLSYCRVFTATPDFTCGVPFTRSVCPGQDHRTCRVGR